MGINNKRVKGKKGSPQKRMKKYTLYGLQHGECYLCGEWMPPILTGNGAADEDNMPTLDHIVRKRGGGVWANHNLRLTHKKCNAERS